MGGIILSEEGYNRSIKGLPPKGGRVRLLYVGTEPERDVRMHGILKSLEKHGYYLSVLRPRMHTRRGGRLFSAFVRYASYLLQVLVARADAYWVANSPDVVGLPLVLKRSTYLYDFRSPWSEEVAQEFGGSWISRVAKIMEDLVRSNASVLLLNADTLMDDTERYEKPVLLAPNYPSSDFKASMGREEFRKGLNLPAKTKVVLFVGRLTKVEGADQLWNLTNKLAKMEGVELWVVGDGPLRPLVEDLASHWPSTVRFFGWQPHTEVANFINAADVCIVPRRKSPLSRYYNETGVMKISEYMMFRKPIVCSGVAPSDQYLLVEEAELTQGVMQALEDKAPIPKPRTWENDVEPQLIEAVKAVMAAAG